MLADAPEPKSESGVLKQMQELRELILAKQKSGKIKLSPKVKQAMRKKTREALRTYGVANLEDSSDENGGS